MRRSGLSIFPKFKEKINIAFSSSPRLDCHGVLGNLDNPDDESEIAAVVQLRNDSCVQGFRAGNDDGASFSLNVVLQAVNPHVSSVPSFSNRQVKKGFTKTTHCDDNEISFLISRFRKNPDPGHGFCWTSMLCCNRQSRTQLCWTQSFIKFRPRLRTMVWMATLSRYL